MEHLTKETHSAAGMCRAWPRFFIGAEAKRTPQQPGCRPTKPPSSSEIVKRRPSGLPAGVKRRQGNTRVLFTAAPPAPQATTSNFETTTNANVQNYTRYNFDLFDHTDAGTTKTYSQRLTGGSGSQVGVAKTYAVYAGDKVKIEAWAKYYNPQSTASNLSGFAAALAGAFGVSSASTGEAQKAYNALNNYGGLTANATNGHSANGYPKLFVNILLFDKDYVLVDAAWQQIDGGEQPVGNATKLPHDYLSAELTASEAGFAYVYISHENATLVEGYFDDVVMTHTPSNVIQYNEYYPFGLQTANSWTRANTTANNFLANGGTELNTTSNLYDLEYRNYDPTLGRMNAVDPMASKYSSLTPYNYSFNDPVTFNDPSGADPHEDWMAEQNALQQWFNNTMPLPMDPGGGGSTGGGSAYYNSMMGGYGASGWNNAAYGPHLGDLTAQWNPDFNGPVQYTNALGETSSAFPSQLAWANRASGGVLSSLAEGSSIPIYGYRMVAGLDWRAPGANEKTTKPHKERYLIGFRYVFGQQQQASNTHSYHVLYQSIKADVFGDEIIYKLKNETIIERNVVILNFNDSGKKVTSTGGFQVLFRRSSSGEVRQFNKVEISQDFNWFINTFENFSRPNSVFDKYINFFQDNFFVPEPQKNRLKVVSSKDG
jgi:RHS repeat-associated protein